MRDLFCSNCGVEFAELSWPRHCTQCQADFWRNPQPVVVTLVPVKTPAKTGIILIKRGIPPHIGEWALPGGFMEYNETWQQTASRELMEETGVVIPETDFSFFDIKNSTDNGKLLIFALAKLQNASVVKNFKLNSEVTEISIALNKQELCFPLHTEQLDNWFFLINMI